MKRLAFVTVLTWYVQC